MSYDDAYDYDYRDNFDGLWHLFKLMIYNSNYANEYWYPKHGTMPIKNYDYSGHFMQSVRV